MKYDKSFLRNKSLLIRKKKYSTVKQFNYNLIFELIRKHFHGKKITIGGYYPSNYEVNIIKFLEEASKKKFKITLPVIKSSNKMSFKSWVFKEPLYVNKFGILEPKNSKKKIIPDLIMVPLVAFDNRLNRIGYGKGYYDRFLDQSLAFRLALAFDFQLLETVPTEMHDVPMDGILTENGFYFCGDSQT